MPAEGRNRPRCAPLGRNGRRDRRRYVLRLRGRMSSISDRHHPTVELAVTGKQADGGIILTASHNPKQWNALKSLTPARRISTMRKEKYWHWPAYRLIRIDRIGRVSHRTQLQRRTHPRCAGTQAG